jgi:hypothetical protein
VRLPGRAPHRLLSLSEAECYARCHGGRTPDVKVVQVERRRPRYETSVSGEALRAAFERRLDTREADA